MSDEEKKETLDEAKIMENLSHPNIIHFREVYKTKRGKLCIVMDYADGGDLQKYLKTTKKYLKEDQILDWFTQICLSMKHVHDKKILHRDLKSQNIFLTKSEFVKLGDFGIARVLTHTKDIAKTVVGTPYYLSPEIIENRPYSFASDIWSLGVLLYEMCALRPPFDAGSLHELASKILKGKYSSIPSFYSENMSLLIATLLKVNPKDRPNINQILKFPLLSERIPAFLSEDTFKDEFSHTIIHNKLYFEAAKAMEEKKDEEQKLEPIQEEESPEEYYKKYVKYINK
jgi:NIMA (never in mitosis gene a)-related kinase